MFEVYFDDLKEEKQKEFIDLFGDNGNYDVFPMFQIETHIEEREDSE